ncbi:hypothetical protein Tco_1130753, partial [Tanacetum coccineum]
KLFFDLSKLSLRSPEAPLVATFLASIHVSVVRALLMGDGLLIRVNVSRHELVGYTQANRPSTFSIPFDPTFPSALSSFEPYCSFHPSTDPGDAIRRGGVVALVGSGLGSISRSSS